MVRQTGIKTNVNFNRLAARHDTAPRRKRRYRPGALALQEIKRYRNTTSLLVSLCLKDPHCMDYVHQIIDSIM